MNPQPGPTSWPGSVPTLPVGTNRAPSSADTICISNWGRGSPPRSGAGAPPSAETGCLSSGGVQLQTGPNYHDFPEGETLLSGPRPAPRTLSLAPGGACLGSQRGSYVWSVGLSRYEGLARGGAAPAPLTSPSPLQMADSGGLPQVTQVRDS